MRSCLAHDDSLRTVDADGHIIVAATHQQRERLPLFRSEMPDYQRFGLIADKVYRNDYRLVVDQLPPSPHVRAILSEPTGGVI